MWGSVLLTGFLFFVSLDGCMDLGWLTQPFVENAKSLDGTEEERASFWDGLRNPS